MKKMVQCSSCGKDYEIDLEKYGGKKIKCKQCQAVIQVPTASDTEEEFDVVEEPPTSPVPSKVSVPGTAPQSILQRHRTASQRGAVNIALLKRAEDSRAAIRQAFLDVHGGEAARLQALQTPQQEMTTAGQALAETQETLDKLKDVLASERARSADSVAREPILSTLKKVTGQDHLGEAYKEAVRILGKPVRELPPRRKMGFMDAVTFRAMEYEREYKKEERQIQLDTVEGAIKHLETVSQEREGERAQREQELQQQVEELARRPRSLLQHASNLMAEGNMADATNILQDLVKTAPVEMIGEVLVALSKCTFVSGNASNAARHIQDAICFGASAPVDMDEHYNDLWAKAASGLPSV